LPQARGNPRGRAHNSGCSRSREISSSSSCRPTTPRPETARLRPACGPDRAACCRGDVRRRRTRRCTGSQRDPLCTERIVASFANSARVRRATRNSTASSAIRSNGA
jgi:hypothetical protein